MGVERPVITHKPFQERLWPTLLIHLLSAELLAKRVQGDQRVRVEPLRLSGQHVVRQWVPTSESVDVELEVVIRVEKRVRFVTLHKTAADEMHQRVDARRPGIGGPVVFPVEKRVRVDAYGTAHLQVVCDRVQVAEVARRRDVPPCYKQRMRVQSLAPSH